MWEGTAQDVTPRKQGTLEAVLEGAWHSDHSPVATATLSWGEGAFISLFRLVPWNQAMSLSKDALLILLGLQYPIMIFI